MTSTFLVQLDHGSDTDLIGIATDIEETLNQHGNGLIVLSVKPWTHPSLLSGTQPQTPPVAPANET